MLSDGWGGQRRRVKFTSLKEFVGKLWQFDVLTTQVQGVTEWRPWMIDRGGLGNLDSGLSGFSA
jgi:hypothetical protein